MDSPQPPHHDRSDRHERTDRDRKHKSRRSRSPRRDDDRHSHGKHRSHRSHRSRSPTAKPVKLPYQARPLSKHDFKAYKPLFQSYLDIQKQIQLDELDEREARGRWKSFTSRWNRGELARSWYDPSMLQSAQQTVQEYGAKSQSPPPVRRGSPQYTKQPTASGQQSDSSDDDFGPAPPTQMARAAGHGPTIPRFDDLTHRNELRNEDAAHDRSAYASDTRYERKAERKTQKERADELAPRADPGSRERQLEKKRETTSTLHSFRDAKEGGDVEIGENELMGDDGIDGYKAKKKADERVKNEREIRREEIARARAAEREEALSARRAKEAQTMEFLKQLAQERFG
ncbi:hypothetical protein C7974DRAFT_319397 [Boeremia exigua]|uniref:uncharacterized protein n=1 Tax=Boeremia exigua TaxID=749465 RepID=UPI001E8DF664|nr:uncharacterized protein C7974DRAFT_319397 [Boeremia exigua]KAH6616426.1 hypothetical protein C7974DRAFT_319397 [Boeremia exigua]